MRSYANRGKPFESLINHSNLCYQLKGWAYIEKAEPPVKVKSHQGSYIQGWFEKPGFVDYFGISHGRALAFEAKSTNVRTSFPMKNISKEQVEALRKWKDQGGISFLLVEFEKHDEVYLMMIDQFLLWWEAAELGGRKSIPYSWFQMECEVVISDRGIVLDYLSILNLP